MNGLGILILVAVTMLLVVCIVPIAALATRHEITESPLKRCGPRCVIETFVFDDEEEAKLEAEKNHTKVYQVTGVEDRWFVEVMMTEVEANGRVE